MKVNKSVLHISACLALLTIFLLPGKTIMNGAAPRSEYGFPIRFYIQYHNQTNGSDWLIKSVSIQILFYLMDTVIIYSIILGLLFLIKRLRSGSINKEK